MCKLDILCVEYVYIMLSVEYLEFIDQIASRKLSTVKEGMTRLLLMKVLRRQRFRLIGS